MTVEEGGIGLRFVVRYGDGRTEQLVVDAERALIGSAAHCEVRLPTESAAPEHVEVFASDRRVHLSARPNERPPTLDGIPCITGPWPAGRILTIGAATLTVESVELGQRQKTRSPFWLFAPVPLVVLAVTVLFARGAGETPPPIPEAPSLFDAAQATCPAAAPDQLRAFASEKLRLGFAKRERSPFSVRDGVDAAPLFEAAAACFKAANLPENERAATAAATTLRQKLEDEYRVRRVRLEHAYRINDPVAAKRELTVLIPMTSHRPGPFLEWMKWVDRAASLEIDRRANKL